MDLSRPKFLAFARRLALLTSTAAPTLVACAGSSPPISNPVPASSSATAETSGAPTSEPTAGAGPCRCSWDTNASAAPRVCKKGEINYDGDRCIPAAHSGDYEGGGGYPGGGPVMKGPLPPPDLAV